jgi:hypothetical protein
MKVVEETRPTQWDSILFMSRISRIGHYTCGACQTVVSICAFPLDIR